MPRQNLTTKVNGLAAIAMQLCEELAHVAKVFAPETDEIHTRLQNMRACAYTIIDESAGFPMATTLETSPQPQEVQA
jgi:hypothetical protein